ncbi:MAG: 3-methyl-2-oxobutanoate hydroxymethyltransferase [Desulfobacterales bacterium]|nr:3-methyl-2-oxobutanoate hydroxymethyltransferase [Desulfobacterales bacterium]
MKKNLKFLNEKKGQKSKITMLSCYDYPTSLLAEQAGVDIILVGDSVGAKMLGYKNPNQVTMEDMIHHLKAVCRAVTHSYVMADLPLTSVETPAQALKDARIFLDHGSDGVKIEVFETEILSLLSENGIEVCVDLIYPFLQHRDSQSPVVKLLADYVTLSLNHQRHGAALLVFTMAPEEIAKVATEQLKIPTIGVGSGRYTDGQALIAAEMLGMSKATHYYNKLYDAFEERVLKAMQTFVNEVINNEFPTEHNCPHIGEDQIKEVKELTERMDSV